MPRSIAGLPAVRPLTRVARKLGLRKACSFELARLRAKVAPATPDPIDDEPATAAIPVQSMREMVFGDREAS